MLSTFELVMVVPSIVAAVVVVAAAAVQVMVLVLLLLYFLGVGGRCRYCCAVLFQ